MMTMCLNELRPISFSFGRATLPLSRVRAGDACRALIRGYQVSTIPQLRVQHDDSRLRPVQFLPSSNRPRKIWQTKIRSLFYVQLIYNLRRKGKAR